MSQIEQTMSSQSIYEGRILNLRVDTVEMDGKKYTKREIVEHAPVVCILALTEDNNILMVRQFRKAVDKELLELPAGFVEIDEEPVEAAKRELEEETGYYPHKCEYISEFYTSPGFCNEKVYLFFAEDLEKREQHLDDCENLTFEKISFDDVLKQVRVGDIIDAKTILGILLYNNLRGRYE